MSHPHEKLIVLPRARTTLEIINPTPTAGAVATGHRFEAEESHPMTPAPLDPLTRAAIRHGSDKYGGHLYTPTYHHLFGALREKPLRLLEIGIGGYETERAGGAGLKMWAEYFPNATITGLDIQRKNLSLPPRIRTVHGSQVDRDLLVRVNAERGPFDIVIDDGSHVVLHMIETFRVLYPLIASDGIYAIEDTQTSFMPALGGRPDGVGTIFDLAHKLSLALHKAEGYVAPDADPAIDELARMTISVAVYRNIVVFQRGPNTYPSNHGLDMSNPEVSSVFERIAKQDEWDPTPAGVLSRIDMLIWGHRVSEAADLARTAANRYPKDVPLLYELIRMMEWAQQQEVKDEMAMLLAHVL